MTISHYDNIAIRYYCQDILRTCADQKIKETPDGVILSFSSAQYSKVLELVLANGRDAMPLEPVELVKDWRDNIRDMQKRVKSLGK